MDLDIDKGYNEVKNLGGQNQWPIFYCYNFAQDIFLLSGFFLNLLIESEIRCLRISVTGRKKIKIQTIQWWVSKWIIKTIHMYFEINEQEIKIELKHC